MLMTEKTVKKGSRLHGDYRRIVAAVLVAAMLLGIVGLWLSKNYESSVLDIYANQQDDYVQQILELVNAQPDYTDEELAELFASLDMSDKNYWILSGEKELLFVKNEKESKRYRGFTMRSLFESDSAGEFVEQLEQNHVIHENIVMEEENYVASGVIFEYQDAYYALCLLTAESVVLDNNTFLSAKISENIYVFILLLTLALSVMILMSVADKRKREIQRLQSRNENLNCEMKKLEDELNFMDSYHTRWNLFHVNVMETFVKKLEAREVHPVTFVKLQFKEQKKYREFLDKAQLLLDEKVLRFTAGEKELILLFVQFQIGEAETALQSLEPAGFEICKTAVCQEKEQQLYEVYKEFLQEDKERE